MEFNHYSVLKKEAINGLSVKPNGIYVDATLGGGGHSLEIAKMLDTGRLVCIDRDSDAIEFSKIRLKDYSDKIIFVKDNYSNIEEILKELNIEKVDGILADLGISSYQIDMAERGFSYMKDAPLDMRMDVGQEMTAKIVVNEFSKDELKKILYNYGEEKYADFFVREIIKYREKKGIETTGELSGILVNAAKRIRYDSGHPAKKTFQAVRICVNNETENIPPAIKGFFNSLKKGGRLVIIDFHSIEDKAVKTIFNEYAGGCICPKNLPCVCGKIPEAKIITKKPIYPSESEISENIRSSSAKMRILEKLI